MQQAVNQVNRTTANVTPVALSRALARLQTWFSTEFFCYDAEHLRELSRARSLPLRNRERFDPLLRVIAQGGPARYLDGEGAISLWALRFPVENQTVLGLSAFLTDLAPVRVEDVCRVLQCNEAEAQQWIHGRAIWPHRGLDSFLQVTMQNLSSVQREAQLREENQSLAASLTNSFEELTLLHDLSSQLRLDVNPRSLCENVLRSLAACVNAKTVAATWKSAQGTHVVQMGKRHSDAEILSAAASLWCDDRIEPLVINSPGDPADWRARAVAVKVNDNGQPIGMLLALGRHDAAEFGTTEANIMQSIAGVFGGFVANHRLYTEARELFQGAVQALTSAIDAKDPYTCGHSNRVARMSKVLALALDMNDDEVEAIYLSGLLHDVGKIGIDERVLRKPDRLTEEEFEHIKQHPDLGYRILVNVPTFKPFLPGVRHHHEAWDGTGYPDGLAGNAIPRQAQVIAVADSLDAMTSNRPYRRGMAIERVEMILREGQGTQWAPDVVDAYFNCRDELAEIIQEGRRLFGSPQADQEPTPSIVPAANNDLPTIGMPNSALAN